MGEYMRMHLRSLRSITSTWRFGALLVAALCMSAALLSIGGKAALPSNGTLTTANTANNPLTYTSGPFLTSNPTDQVTGVPTCSAQLPCDDYTLTVDVPAGSDLANYIKIQVGWPNQVTLAQYDTFIFKLNPDNSLGPLIAANFFAVDPDVVTISAVAGKYLLRIAPTIAQGDTTTTKITYEPKVGAAPGGSGLSPRFQRYQAPAGVGNSAGEPSIGVGLTTAQFPTGRTMFEAGTTTLRVDFNDCPSPASTVWATKTPPNTSTTTLDPILFTDRYTGRTFVSQLAGACSRAAYTDTASPFSDGDQWVPSQGCGVPAGIDHQTFGGGPVAKPLPTPPAYPDGVYYCSQSGTNEASCAISLDGGLTFGPAVPIYAISCFGIHGHVKVAPDGTAYVPNSDCSTTSMGGTGTAKQGLVFSEDNGMTWSQPQLVPDSNPAPGIVDPSIGIGANGTIYYGYANSNGAPSIAVGHKINHQIVWSGSQDVGAALGIQNSTFPEVVAGDDDRAAFAFLGTTTGGYYQDPQNFQGVWHLYVATTYDGGESWRTVDATPNDPVQRGSICNSGTVICSHVPDDRNLLDFMDITIDRQGRIEVAFPDGCITATCINGGANDFTRKASIARQSGGRRLLSAFDPVEPAVPAAPRVTSATRDTAGAHLKFLEPDNGGSPITGYKIYRGMTGGSETLLATVVNPTTTYDITNLANQITYDDTTANPGLTYFYRVSATNSSGEGTFCGESQLTPVCTDVALLSNLAIPIASSTDTFYNFSASSAIDGDRTGRSWGSGGGWNDGTFGVWPDTFEVDFNGSKTIREIRVYTLQDNWTTAGEPDQTTPATGEGILDFDVQTWDGIQWVNLPGNVGHVTNNDKAMRVFTLATPITTTKIQIVISNGRNGYSRLVEVEAFTCP